MSTGGVFKLMANQAPQDKLLMATDTLSRRIKELRVTRLKELHQQYPEKSNEQILAMMGNWMPDLNILARSHVIFVNSTFKPFVSIGLEYTKTGVQGGQFDFGKSAIFTLPVFGQFINDCVVNVQISSFQAVNAGDKVRWCEFLGHRLFKQVDFKVQGNPMDTYGSDEYNAFYQYKLPVNKELGYLRCIGQEIPKLGYLTADPVTDEYREYRLIGDGPQTFKQIQPALDLWIPLLFWFRDIQCSLPNFVIPYGQTNITIELESIANLVSYAAYVGTGAYTQPRITKMELYINNIFLNPDVFQIFVTNFGFQLIRLHKKHTEFSLTKNADEIRLMSLKYPIESLYIGFKPQSNLNSSQLWWRNTVCTQESIPMPVCNANLNILSNELIYYNEAPPVETLEVAAHGVTIFQNATTKFYNSYLPYRYGDTLKTPSDVGMFFMNFGMSPNTYQPSGHLNISVAREFYLRYESNFISNANPTNLSVMADAINFLLVRDGSAILRFAT